MRRKVFAHDMSGTANGRGVFYPSRITMVLERAKLLSGEKASSTQDIIASGPKQTSLSGQWMPACAGIADEGRVGRDFRR
jgi:hypothetical protein